MQTFLPYPDFQRSAQCLDNKRLGKQRSECLQLLNALLMPKPRGWANHPAAKMWRGHEHDLVDYGLAICSEWMGRGYRDTCAGKIAVFDLVVHHQRNGVLPSWFGDERFHAAHRSNLLRKDPVWYGRFGWTEPSDLPYLWPESQIIFNKGFTLSNNLIE